MKKPTSSKHLWFREKSYIHFDTPIGSKRAEKYVASFQKNPTHDFYPFLTYTLTTRKVVRVPVSERNDPKQTLRFKPKKRPLAYAAHRDRAIYSYYSYLLSNSYESYLKDYSFSESIIGFRKLGKNNIHFAKDVFRSIENYNTCLVIAMDIKSFFDNLDHKILKYQWKEVLGKSNLPNDHYQVFKAITKYSTIDQKAVYEALNISRNNPPKNLYRLCDSTIFRSKIRPLINVNTNARFRTKGIPQGSPISAVLSNIYMLEFDKDAYELANSLGGKYYRYCDDILFILPHISESGHIYEDRISQYVNNLKLDLNPDKTEVFYFENQKIIGKNNDLQYLGFTFNGSDILLRSAGIQKCYNKIRRSTKLASRTRNKRLKAAHPLAKNNINRRKLYKQYSYLGKRNYISYALRASKIMSSTKINKQVKPIWGFLNKEVAYWDNNFWKKNLRRKFYPLKDLLIKNNCLPSSSFALKPYSSFKLTLIYFKN